MYIHHSAIADMNWFFSRHERTFSEDGQNMLFSVGAFWALKLPNMRMPLKIWCAFLIFFGVYIDVTNNYNMTSGESYTFHSKKTRKRWSSQRTTQPCHCTSGLGGLGGSTFSHMRHACCRPFLGPFLGKPGRALSGWKASDGLCTRMLDFFGGKMLAKPLINQVYPGLYIYTYISGLVPLKFQHDIPALYKVFGFGH